MEVEDANSVARIFPYGGSYAKATISKSENSSRHFDATKRAQSLGPSSRETTVSLESQEDHEDARDKAYEFDNGLHLTFGHPPKGRIGFAFGRNPNACDVVLPNVGSGISGRHFYLTFDHQNRLIIKDASRNGTIVEYNGKGGFRRKSFTWIISGHSVVDRKKLIVVKPHDQIWLRIVVSKHQACKSEYVDNVRRFREEMTENDQLPMSLLGLPSLLSTAENSEAQTVSQKSILLEDKQLGEGSFELSFIPGTLVPVLNML